MRKNPTISCGKNPPDFCAVFHIFTKKSGNNTSKITIFPHFVGYFFPQLIEELDCNFSCLKWRIIRTIPTDGGSLCPPRSLSSDFCLSLLIVPPYNKASSGASVFIQQSGTGSADGSDTVSNIQERNADCESESAGNDSNALRQPGQKNDSHGLPAATSNDPNTVWPQPGKNDVAPEVISNDSDALQRSGVTEQDRCSAEKLSSHGEMSPADSTGSRSHNSSLKNEKRNEEVSEMLNHHEANKLGSLGLLALLKMIIADNFIHADLHPGNVLVRHMEKPNGVFQRLKTHFQSKLLGIEGRYDQTPQLCFLDAGLSAFIEPSKEKYVADFFRGMLLYEGKMLAEAILNLSDGIDGKNLTRRTDPTYTQDEAEFIEELQKKSERWREIREDPMLYLKCRSGDCMKDALASCRTHNIELHPTVLIAVVSAITLEGWQFELDPSCCILDHVDTIIDGQRKLDTFLSNGLESIDHRSYEEGMQHIGFVDRTM